MEKINSNYFNNCFHDWRRVKNIRDNNNFKKELLLQKNDNNCKSLFDNFKKNVKSLFKSNKVNMVLDIVALASVFLAIYLVNIVLL